MVFVNDIMDTLHYNTLDTLNDLLKDKVDEFNIIKIIYDYNNKKDKKTIFMDKLKNWLNSHIITYNDDDIITNISRYYSNNYPNGFNYLDPDNLNDVDDDYY